MTPHEQYGDMLLFIQTSILGHNQRLGGIYYCPWNSKWLCGFRNATRVSTGVANGWMSVCLTSLSINIVQSSAFNVNNDSGKLSWTGTLAREIKLFVIHILTMSLQWTLAWWLLSPGTSTYLCMIRFNKYPSHAAHGFNLLKRPQMCRANS